jgi:hypothetical protein
MTMRVSELLMNYFLENVLMKLNSESSSLIITKTETLNELLGEIISKRTELEIRTKK